jgi:hypothetical protein
MYTLLWSCPIEICHMLIEHALELLLVVNQEGIETFATHATQKPSTDGTCSWGSIRRSEQFDVGHGCHTSKA